PPDCCVGMAFDADTRRVVLFEGDTGQTWSWDGTTWTREHPASSPSSRQYPSMSRSGPHDLLFGGEDCIDFTCYYRDTWSWTGSTWTKLRPVPRPGNRSHAGMAYDLIHRQVVLFGGFGDSGT